MKITVKQLESEVYNIIGSLDSLENKKLSESVSDPNLLDFERKCQKLVLLQLLNKIKYHL
jgi:hypothetical protein